MINITILESILSCEKLPDSLKKLNKHQIEKIFGSNYSYQKRYMDYENVSGIKVLQERYSITEFVEITLYDDVVEDVQFWFVNNISSKIGNIKIEDYNLCRSLNMKSFISILRQHMICYEINDALSSNGLITLFVFTKINGPFIFFNLINEDYFLVGVLFQIV